MLKNRIAMREYVQILSSIERIQELLNSHTQSSTMPAEITDSPNQLSSLNLGGKEDQLFGPIEFKLLHPAKEGFSRNVEMFGSSGLVPIILFDGQKEDFLFYLLQINAIVG